MIRTAVIGAGYLGRFHAQKYASMDDVALVGVVDLDTRRAAAVAAETGTIPYDDFHDIIGKVDAVSVVVPTIYHYEVASVFLSHGIHCLVEKPITTTVEQADHLIRLAHEHGVVLQIGHLERFNPAVKVLEELAENPLFIEAHRLSGFKDRATDVDVVLDLMIHDIEIVLALVQAPVAEYRAVGVPVLTPRVDIANARLIFENGCTANLTASRISLQNMRRIRLFQQGAYISADCTEQKNLVVKNRPLSKTRSAILPQEISHENRDILYDELAAFIRAVCGMEAPLVSGQSGREALNLALDINALIGRELEKTAYSQSAE